MTHLAAAALSVVFAAALAGGAGAEVYRLTQEDRVELRVGQWDPEEQRFEPWPGISGEYSVGPEGQLSIALAGLVPAAGQSTGELADEIAMRLQRAIGLRQPPAVSLEIVAYRPIHVGGAVQSPGLYPYRFGMTVEQAVTVAGGPPGIEPGTPADPTHALRLAGEIRQYSARLDDLAAEEDRLMVDLASSGQPDLTDAPLMASAVGASGALEADILASQRDALRAQRDSSQDLQALLTARIARLDAQIALRGRQIEITGDELATVETLRDRGLAVNTRVTALSTALNDHETRRIQLEVARLTAEQQLNRARREQAALLDRTRLDRLAALKAARSEMAALHHRLETARQILAAIGAPDTADPRPDRPGPIYRVTRPGADGTEVLRLGPTDPLRPGDTLVVGFDAPLQISQTD